MNYRTACVLFLLLLCGLELPAQEQSQQGQQQQVFVMPKPRRVGNPALRYEVDAKRTGTNMNSDDALPRSREFIRIDSSYYVGWMYEGAYKYNHAADYAGYKNAEEPLERALRQIERDYAPELRTRTKNVLQYIQNYNRQIDYSIIVNYLNQCYLNTDQPDKVFALMHRYLKWDFQRDFFDAYDYLMWVTHRNRYYTSDKYFFLKNSIAANEALANRYLDSALNRIRRNARFNVGIYNPGYDKNDYLGVYHYKSMLWAYQFKIDSAEKYFNLLRNTPFFPHNNYATFKSVIGDFAAAEEEYRLARDQDPGDKRLQEWAYYSSILDIYKGLPKRGELLMKDMIMANGSTPGFGWYNIALARCLHYDGQISESERHNERAASFKELHIGTTLSQSQYDFSIQLIKLMNLESNYELRRFENNGWWYSPGTLSGMSKLMAERYMQEFLIINSFAQNPERDQVIYRLFSTESTISWDEVFQLVKNFSANFFIKKFRASAENDPRPAIRKYFRLTVARLQVQEGNFKDAQPELLRLTQDPNVDKIYEKLYLARCYEALARCADGLNQPLQRDQWLYRLFQIYPQLIPFSGMKMPLQLQVTGAADEAVLARLRDCNIRFDDPAASLTARLRFQQKSGFKFVTYSVIDRQGRLVVPEQRYGYSKDVDVAGVSLALRLFGVGGLPKQDS